MKIGIGIITKDRPAVIAESLRRHAVYSKFDKIVVVDDGSNHKNMYDLFNLFPTYFKPSDNNIVMSTEWFGVAAARNMCLSMLDDCDHVFIMDDDVFMITDKWVDVYLTAHKLSGNNVLLAVPNVWGIPLSNDGIVCRTERSIGAFMSMTKNARETLGGFDTSFGKYGYEDTDYFSRLDRTSLNKSTGFISKFLAEIYIHICDVYGAPPGCPDGFILPGTSTLSPDIKAAQLAEAWPKYLAKYANNNPIFKPYK